jgi:hypothetical protein
MPYKQPPVEHQFKKGNPGGGHRGHKGPYILPALQKIALKHFKIEDPETEKLIKMKGKDAVALRLFWSALQGEVPAIKELLERLDGKVDQKNINEMSGQVTIMGQVIVDDKPLDLSKVG